MTQNEENSSTSENQSCRNFVFMLTNPVYYNGEKETRVVVKVDGIEISAVIDSGCPVTIVNNETYANMVSRGFVEKDFVSGCKIPFYGYELNRPAIEIKGSCSVQITYGNLTINERIYIAPYGRENLLGKNTAEKLKLLKIDVYDVKPVRQFPKLKNCSINVTINRKVKPVRVTYRRMPLEVEKKIHAEVHKLLESGIIEPVPTEKITWVSRMLAIPKEDGEYRLVIDMRMPNTAVSSEYYPQPSVEEALLLPNIARMSKIDLKKGFYLCELDSKCRDITAFATKNGVFQFTRLMFGLKSAPELFNRELDRIFANHKGISKYCDDFLIFGGTQEEHDTNLNAVLKTIDEEGLEINEQKSVYNVTQVKFLGHIVTTNGTFPDPEKVKDIKSFRAPQNKSELQTLLGLATFLGRYIANLSEITGPLRKLLNKDTDFVWEDEQRDALVKLKGALTRDTFLSFFVRGRTTILVADAGPNALGAVLLQSDQEKYFVIAYASKALTETESKYYQTEKEALAIVWSCEKFATFLVGILFDLWTDCKPLEYLFKPNSKPCARLERWILRLQSFSFNVIHKPGKLNIADPLSRLCNPIESCDVSEECHLIRLVRETSPAAVTPREIELETTKDAQLEEVKKALKSGNWSTVDKAYESIKGLVF